jgi:arylsulfatase A-like enzyme
MPELFRAAGYKTGIFGKWHLGDAFPSRPEDRGFDEVFVHGGGGIGQTPDHWGNGYFDPMIRRRGGWEKTAGYCTDVFFNEAIRWLGERVARDEPFFLHLAPNAAHAPYVAPERDSKLSGEAAYRAMIGNLDANFAKLLEALEKSGAAERTVVVFLTDNGSPFATTNAGMKGQKASPDEGGVRVPCFVRWPGKIAAGKVVPEIAAHLDLRPADAKFLGDVVIGHGVQQSQICRNPGVFQDFMRFHRWVKLAFLVKSGRLKPALRLESLHFHKFSCAAPSSAQPPDQTPKKTPPGTGPGGVWIGFSQSLQAAAFSALASRAFLTWATMAENAAAS